MIRFDLEPAEREALYRVYTDEHLAECWDVFLTPNRSGLSDESYRICANSNCTARILGGGYYFCPKCRSRNRTHWSGP